MENEKSQQKMYVYGQSGIHGFSCVTKNYEYQYQKMYQYVPGYDFTGMVPVIKTVTLDEKPGNTPLVDGYKIRDFLPKSIYCTPQMFWDGVLLNCVGLSNPGLKWFLNNKIWEHFNGQYFQLSIQIQAKIWPEIEIEIKKICALLNTNLSPMLYHYDIQINDSCPNVKGHKQGFDKEKLELTRAMMMLFKSLMPTTNFWLKYNALTHPDVLNELQSNCTGYVISNTIPFGDTTYDIDWKRWFPDGISPIPARINQPYESAFMGGLSGIPLFPILVDALSKYQASNNSLHINAGGGIFTKGNIDTLAEFEIVKCVSLGSVAPLRFWKVKKLIKYGNKVFTEREDRKSKK